MSNELTPKKDENPVVPNSWRTLRRFTEARIGLGRAGNSIPTRELLAFQMDHANAQDAVHIPLDRTKLLAELTGRFGQVSLASQAKDRATYLQRPDLGRRLSPDSAERLAAVAAQQNDGRFQVAVVVVDGLSSTAVQNHAATMANLLCEQIAEAGDRLAPICLVEQGRVAIGDEIGELLGVDCLILLVGERPGLSSPDSLGIYYTYRPQVGLQDSSRNCISNIRPGGLSFAEASGKLLWLMAESRKIERSGVMLKDESDEVDTALGDSPGRNFLLP